MIMHGLEKLGIHTYLVIVIVAAVVVVVVVIVAVVHQSKAVAQV